MNLILQAIKSLFRKHNENIVKVNQRIDDAETKIEDTSTAVQTAQSIADNALTTAEDVKSIINSNILTVRLPQSGTKSLYEQCIDAHERGDNIIAVKDGLEYEFNKYENGAFYFRRYDPGILQFTEYKVGASSSATNTCGITANRLDDLYRAPSGKAVQDAINTAKHEARNYVIINSSTSGSTKQFKITVDDSGTLAVTEV